MKKYVKILKMSAQQEKKWQKDMKKQSLENKHKLTNNVFIFRVMK